MNLAPPRSHVLLTALGFLTVAVIGCEKTTDLPTDDNSTDLSASQEATTTTSHSASEVSEDQAVELALAFARLHGPYLRGFLEMNHGGPINFDALGWSGKVYSASSAVRLGRTDVAESAKRSMGSYWLVPLIQDQVRTLTVAVSKTTSVVLNDSDNYNLTWPTHHGDDFYIIGMPERLGPQYPVPRHEALERVQSATGITPSSSATLVIPPLHWPVMAKWRFSFEKPVTVDTKNDQSISVDQIWVDFSGKVQIDAAAGTPAPRSTGRQIEIVVPAAGSGAPVKTALLLDDKVPTDWTDLANQ